MNKKKYKNDFIEPALDYSAHMLNQIPPQSLETERVIFSSILTGGVECIETIMEKVKCDHFYATQNRKLFKSIQDLYKDNVEITSITLVDDLKRKDWLEDCGSEIYIAELMDMYSLPAKSLKSHIDILVEKSDLRKVISLSTNASVQAFQPDGKSKEIVNNIESEIDKILIKRDRCEVFHVKEVVSNLMVKYENKESPPVISTGFKNIDDMLGGGIGLGEYAIIAGRPGQGKTSLACAIADRVSSRKDENVLLFSLEMTKEQVVERSISRDGSIDKTKLRYNNLSKDDMKVVCNSAANIAGLNYEILDDPLVDIYDIKRTVKIRKRLNPNLKLIIIDYVQIVKSSGNFTDKKLIVEEISNVIKDIAKEFFVAMLALSQLAKEVDKRSNKRPILGDLRETAALEENTHIVMFVYREAVYTGDKKDTRAELIIPKNREGTLGSVWFNFLGQYQQWIPSSEEIVSNNFAQF